MIGKEWRWPATTTSEAGSLIVLDLQSHMPVNSLNVLSRSKTAGLSFPLPTPPPLATTPRSEHCCDPAKAPSHSVKGTTQSRCRVDSSAAAAETAVAANDESRTRMRKVISPHPRNGSGPKGMRDRTHAATSQTATRGADTHLKSSVQQVVIPAERGPLFHPSIVHHQHQRKSRLPPGDWLLPPRLFHDQQALHTEKQHSRSCTAHTCHPESRGRGALSASSLRGDKIWLPLSGELTVGRADACF